MLFVLREVTSTHIFYPFNFLIVLFLQVVSMSGAFLGDLNDILAQTVSFFLHIIAELVFKRTHRILENASVFICRFFNKLKVGQTKGLNAINFVDQLILHIGGFHLEVLPELLHTVHALLNVACDVIDLEFMFGQFLAVLEDFLVVLLHLRLESSESFLVEALGLSEIFSEFADVQTDVLSRLLDFEA